MPPRTPIYRGHKLPGQVVSRGLTGPTTVQRVIQIGNVPPQEVVNTLDDRVIRGTLRFVPHGTDEVTEAAVGNLNGFYGYVANTFGMAIGEYATGKPNITIEDVNGLRIRNYTTDVLTLDLSGNAAFTGAVTAASGAIGGWVIGGATLTGGDAVLSSTGVLTLGTGDDVVILSAADATYRIWVGDATAADAPFSVTKAGSLSATGATIEGDLTATTGELGDLDVTGALVLGTGGIVKSSNYVAGAAGWQIGADGSAEFQDIVARGRLSSVIFEQHKTSVVTGTLKIDANDAERSLAEALEIPASQSGVLVVVDRPGPALLTGEKLWLIDGDNAAWCTSIDDYAAGETAYLVMAESMFGYTVPEGARVVFPVEGRSGHLLLTADPVLNGPRYAVIAADGVNDRSAAILGNLNGSYGMTGDVFGMGIGDYDNDNYLRYEPGGGFVIKAASGQLQIDRDAISIAAHTSVSDAPTLRWVHEDSLVGDIQAAYDGGVSRLMFNAKAVPGENGAEVWLMSQVDGSRYRGIYIDQSTLNGEKIELSSDAALMARWFDDVAIFYTPIERYVDGAARGAGMVVYDDAPWTSTAWDGDTKTAANVGTIDLSTVFGLPAGIKGVFISFNTITTLSANDEQLVGFFPDSTQIPGGASWAGANGVWCQLGNGKWRAAHGFVPCDSNGDVYFHTATTGSNAFNIWVCVTGYVI